MTYTKIGSHSERTIIDGIVVDIDRQFDWCNRVNGATITFKEYNSDGKTLSVLRVLSNYKSFKDARKNVVFELNKLLTVNPF